MPVDEKTRQALDPKKLDLPASPRVVDIEVEDYVDWAGDEALRVWVTIGDETDIYNMSGDDLIQLRRAIHDSLLSHGIGYFPYIFMRTESERREEAGDGDGA